MSGYDYANARLRVMRSRLFTAAALRDLTTVRDLPNLLSSLTRSPYRPAVEMALASQTGLPALQQALQQDLFARIRRAHAFFRDDAARLAGLALQRFDLDNLKAVLRGLAQGVAPEQINGALLPAGTLSLSDWTQLTQAGTARQAVDMMATWRLPLIAPLLALRANRPGVTSLQMEVALERWHFAQIASRTEPALRPLQRFTQLDADITNLMTVLRLAGVQGKERFLEQQFDTPDLEVLLVGPGRIPFGQLLAAANKETVTAAIAAFLGGPFAAPLQAALPHYQQTGQLSQLEQRLRAEPLRLARTFFVAAADDIGIFLGYLILSQNETANLRRIGHGLDLGQPAGEIQADLILEPT